MPSDKKKWTIEASISSQGHQDDVNINGAKHDGAMVYSGMVYRRPNLGEFLEAKGITEQEYSSNPQLYDQEFAEYESNTDNLVLIQPKSSTGMTLADFKDMYERCGDINEVYDQLVNYIRMNVDSNPEAVQNTVMNILKSLNGYYDSSMGQGNVGTSQTDILQKVFESNGEVENMVCGTIHGFIHEVLHDAGVESALISGKATDGTKHSTLIYKQSDGKYVFSNYGRSMVVEAPTIIDATKEAYKSSGTLLTTGYLRLYDDKRGTYTEYALDDVAAFGGEIDKSNLDTETAFTRPDIADNNALRINYSENGTDRIATAKVLMPHGQGQFTFGAEFRQNGDSPVYTQSHSVGGEIGYSYSNPQAGVDVATQGIISYTQGQTASSDYIDNRYDYMRISHPGQTVEHYTVGFRASAGKDFSLIDNENFALENRTRLSFTGSVVETKHNLSKELDCDARLAAEIGLKLNTGDFVVETSAGLMVDRSIGYSGAKPTIGTKTNVGVSYVHNGETTSTTLFANGYGAFSETSTNYGATIGGGITSQVSSGEQYYIKGKVTYAGQHIDVGGFSENTKSSVSPFLEAGITTKSGTTFFAGASYTKDFINPKRDNWFTNLGVRFRL